MSGGTILPTGRPCLVTRNVSPLEARSSNSLRRVFASNAAIVSTNVSPSGWQLVYSVIVTALCQRGAQDKIFQALADPSRRAIFESVTRGEAAVKDLTARFDISQPAVSQHLAALKDAGLVNGRREGRNVYYSIDPRGLEPLVDWIAHYRAFWMERVDRLERLLEKMDE